VAAKKENAMSRPPTPEEKAETDAALKGIDPREFDAGLNWEGDISKLSNAKLKALAIKVWARIPTLSAAGLIIDELIDRLPKSK
jgi:hypothetical protein